jgi:hypothetical protein
MARWEAGLTHGFQTLSATALGDFNIVGKKEFQLC